MSSIGISNFSKYRYFEQRSSICTRSQNPVHRVDFPANLLTHLSCRNLTEIISR